MRCAQEPPDLSQLLRSIYEMSELSKGVLGSVRTAGQLKFSGDRNWEGCYSRIFLMKKSALKLGGKEGGIINKNQD